MAACTDRVSRPLTHRRDISGESSPVRPRCHPTMECGDPSLFSGTRSVPLASGDRYAGFTITEFLGSGANGTTYLAMGSDAHQVLRLKILRRGAYPDGEFRRRFRQTNETLSRLDPRGTPRVIDFGESDGRCWVATEFITGTNARNLLKQRFPTGIPLNSLCVIADHIAHALDETSRHGVVHGSVKPTNILLYEPFSKTYRIVINDFGQRNQSTTPPRDVYAAPEVLSGAIPTSRSDQFALAATVFHLSTGEQAFPGDRRIVTTAGHLDFDTRALSRVETTVDGLTDVFARAFAFDPAARFTSCSEFIDALASPSSATSLPPTRTQAPRTEPEPRRRASEAAEPAKERAGRSVLVPAAAILAVTVTLTVAAVLFSHEKPAPPATSSPSSAPISTAAAPVSACQKLDETLAGLNTRQRLAQTLMVGVTDIDDATAVVNDQGVGGIFITSWTDLSMLTSGALRELQTAPRPIPLAVSVDEEGGRVQRLKSLLTYQDSPRQLVNEGTSAQQVHDIAFERGRKMRDYGITIDFAPVVDVTGAPDNTVIGDRSFSNEAATVTEYAGAYAKGLRDAGLLPVLKHFPGHGRASGDSHQGGVLTPPLDDLKQKDLVPYQTLTTDLPVGVMVGHMQVPDLTGPDPASLSAAAYSLLRQGEYGGPLFDGPIFTDDLSSMGAINQRYGVAEAALKALQAGADTALWISTDQVPAVLDRLEAAVKDGELTEARVDDAVRHMAITKEPGFACTP